MWNRESNEAEVAQQEWWVEDIGIEDKIEAGEVGDGGDLANENKLNQKGGGEDHQVCRVERKKDIKIN